MTRIACKLFFLLIALLLNFSALAQEENVDEIEVEEAFEEIIPQPISNTISELSKNIENIKIDSAAFDTATLKKITEGLNYYEPEKELSKSREFPFKNKTTHTGNVFRGISQVLLIILVIIILGFLIYLIAKQARAKDLKFNDDDEFWQINLNNSEEAEADLEHKLKNATGNEDFIVAIRLNYLLSLNELNRSSLVKWKKDKTNADYVKELRGSDFYEHFKQLTVWFERSWFGRFTPDAKAYSEISYSFRMFIDQIKMHSSNHKDT